MADYPTEAEARIGVYGAERSDSFCFHVLQNSDRFPIFAVYDSKWDHSGFAVNMIPPTLSAYCFLS